MKFAEGSRRATLFRYKLSEAGHIPWCLKRNPGRRGARRRPPGLLHPPKEIPLAALKCWQLLPKPISPPWNREMIRSLVERVALHPTDGGFTIELIGEIARMVALGMSDAEKKTAASLGEVASSVKVVAGTRCQRDHISWMVEV
jgi:hypothetical protein